MSWWIFVAFLSILNASDAINKPVYKIILTQRGYTQFLQYDVDIPPLKEFTFCIWIRVYDLDGDQSIFTYIANGNHRLLRLWLSSGGKFLNFSINGKTATTVPVDITKDIWRHVCLTYQSDYGALGMYVDSKLLSCETRQSLLSAILPGGGSVILGYGTADNGIANGFEGEIFGANLLLKSSIEGDHEAAQDHLFRSKHFHKNKIRESGNNNEYIILSQLKTNNTKNSFEKEIVTDLPSERQSFMKSKTAHPLIEQEIGVGPSLSKLKLLVESKEKELIDFPETQTSKNTQQSRIKFRNSVNKAGREGKFTKNKEQFGSGTSDLPVISEYETPPPPTPLVDEYPVFYNSINEKSKNKLGIYLSDVVLPPRVQQDKKVYGQWTSSKFAGSVLNYLKSINYRKTEKKPPIAIPLAKITDNFPYASEFKIAKLHPSVQFQRRGSIDYKKRIYKRGIEKPQVNVQVLEDDLRTSILKMHAETKAENVVVTNRGESNKSNKHRLLPKEMFQNFKNISRPKPFSISSKVRNNYKASAISDAVKNKNFMMTLPFIKSSHYYEEDSHKKSSQNIPSSNDIYLKSLSNGNKWHNVKSYSNDYTPRRFNMESEGHDGTLEDKIVETNLVHPYVRLKYIPQTHKLENLNDNINIKKGRELAMTIPNEFKSNLDTISIINYNHDYPPYENFKSSLNNKSIRASNISPKKVKNKSSFDHQVKLGNALNEHLAIGSNEEHKMQSFIGGHENVPDINKYRSGSDEDSFGSPPLLDDKVCKRFEHNSRKLYIQRDGSVISSNIESPIRKKSIAIDFIHQNYLKCSLEESNFANNFLVFVDWSNTPVRLFGGAYPKTTTDLCGFF